MNLAMRCRLLVLVGVMAQSISTAANADHPASARYQSRYFLSGLLVRSAMVCKGDYKRTIDASLALIATPELKALSQAYPSTTKEWSMRGAGAFNEGVMTDGITKACAYANKVRIEAEKILKSGQ